MDNASMLGSRNSTSCASVEHEIAHGEGTNPNSDHDDRQSSLQMNNSLFILAMIDTDLSKIEYQMWQVVMSLIPALCNWKRAEEEKKRFYMTENDAIPHQQLQIEQQNNDSRTTNVISKRTNRNTGMRSEEKGDYQNLFPKRQLFQPKLEYPLWHYNWDGRANLSLLTGVTRHLLLIRHGEYDETQQWDHERTLTPLGRKQADLTGRRIAEMIKGVDETFRPCNVKILRVSNMARAKDTADIIATHIPDVERADPDPLLNEGRPAHRIPAGRKATTQYIKEVDKDHPRIEKAYTKYFHRAPYAEEDKMEQSSATLNGDGKLKPHPKHEFEVIVSHGNVIRYFFCRGLQIPPEAWMRFNAFHCSVTYLKICSTGHVSCRMFGDIGHLPYELSTSSGLCGYSR